MPDLPLYTSESYRLHGVMAYGAAVNEDDGTFAQVESNFVFAPPAATTLIAMGRFTRLEYAGVGGFSGAGHMVGVLGWSVVNAAGQTVAAVYGIEGKVGVTAGTVTNGIAVEGQLSGNPEGSTLGTFTAFNGQVATAGNAGTITNFIGCGVSAAGNTGTIANYIGLQVAPPAGTVTNAFGVFITNLVGGTLSIGVYSEISAAAGKFNLFLPGTAPNHMVGDLRIGAGTSGITGAALVVNGAIAIVDGMTAPAAIVGQALIYVDTADGDLKVRFGDGFIRVLGADS